MNPLPSLSCHALAKASGALSASYFLELLRFQANLSSYHAEPSGTFYRYDAKAIGSGSEGAQAELQNEFHKSLTLPEAETLVLKTLKQVMEEKLDSKNVQLASVTKDRGFRIYTDQEMAEVVSRLPVN